MKLLLPLACCLLLTARLTCAAPASDVPRGHWASGAVARLAAKKILIPNPDGKFHGDKPVTRYELAVTLDRLVRYLEASRKPLSASVIHPPVPMPANADSATRSALAHLVSNGFIDSHSPLLQRNSFVTALELTDILAQVTIRLSDRSLPPAQP